MFLASISKVFLSGFSKFQVTPASTSLFLWLADSYTYKNDTNPSNKEPKGVGKLFEAV